MRPVGVSSATGGSTALPATCPQCSCLGGRCRRLQQPGVTSSDAGRVGTTPTPPSLPLCGKPDALSAFRPASGGALPGRHPVRARSASEDHALPATDHKTGDGDEKRSWHHIGPVAGTGVVL